ncbi:hypothetical protein MCEGE10_01864 [Flavobacteriaceae bacterium]
MMEKNINNDFMSFFIFYFFYNFNNHELFDNNVLIYFLMFLTSS